MILKLNQSEKDRKTFEKKNKEPNCASPTAEEIGTDFNFKHKVVWKNVIAFLVFHILGFYGLIIFLAFQIKILTWIYVVMLGFLGGFGITMGAHRLFTHRAFKATTPTRRILMIIFILNGQNSLWEWARDHRQHHKYSDTDADPHNAHRGFFFSHVGWLLSRKHPKVIQYGKKIDMSDLEADSWIMFQKKYFIPIYLVVSIFIPCIFPILLWKEDPIVSLLVCFIGKTAVMLNITWSVNSFAHLHGTKPYDKSILPAQNEFVSFIAGGEGYHNYHHVYPWDYRTAELGSTYNLTAKLIDYCAKKGWVYDLKVPTEESIRNRVRKTGDNSHEKYGDITKYT